MEYYNFHWENYPNSLLYEIFEIQSPALMLLFCLAGVTQVEGDEIILTVYGQNIVTEDKYSSDTEPFHWITIDFQLF